MKDTIGFIGAGNMAEALIKGIVAAGLFTPQTIHASDIRDTQLKKIKKTYGIKTYKDNAEIIARGQKSPYYLSCSRHNYSLYCKTSQRSHTRHQDNAQYPRFDPGRGISPCEGKACN
jgi:hypothetical protein